jgi:hypothetical protein
MSGQRFMIYCTAFFECGTMQSVQFLIPDSVYVKLPPHLSPSMYSGQ